MKNLFKKCLLPLLGTCLCFSSLFIPNKESKISKADENEKTIYFTNKSPYYNVNFANNNSAGYWWGTPMDFANNEATIRRVEADPTTDYYFSDSKITTFEAGNSYVLSFDVKVTGNLYFDVRIANPFQNYCAGWKSNSEYVHYEFGFTVATKSQYSFYIELSAGTGTATFKEIYLHSVYGTAKVKTGEKIGDVFPDISSSLVGEKVDGWKINKEIVHEDSIYNYSSDTVAYPNCKSSRTLALLNGGKVDYTDDLKYFTSSRMPILTEEGMNFSNDDGLVDTSNYDFTSTDFNVEAGKTYRFNFDIKCDNVFFRFCIHSPWSVAFGAWINYENYTSLYVEFSATETKQLTFRLRFDSAVANISIKNLKFYEVTYKKLYENDVIGELPELKNDEVYTNGRWVLDGEIITSDSVFKYDEYKEAYSVYDVQYALKFYGDKNPYLKNLASDPTKWFKIGDSASSVISKVDKDTISLKGKKETMFRFNDSDSLTLIPGDLYKISLKVKTGESKIHIVLNNDWVNGLLKTHYQSKDDYSELNMEINAPELFDNASFFDIQISDGTSDDSNEIFIKDFYLEHVSKVSYYQVGDNISNLPETPEGSKWVMDNVYLDETSTFNEAKNKIARLSPVISYNGENTIECRLGQNLKLDGLTSSSFYQGGTDYIYSWKKASNNETLTEPDEEGQYQLIVQAKDIYGTLSFNSVTINVNVLPRDSVKPYWIRNGEAFTYSETLNITVKAGTYAQLNLEAIDEIDGVVEVNYDFKGLVDINNRFVEGEDDVICSARDLTGNVLTLIVHIRVIK